MPAPAPGWSWLPAVAAALALMAALNACGRVGYDRVTVVDAAPVDPQDARTVDVSPPDSTRRMWRRRDVASDVGPDTHRRSTWAPTSRRRSTLPLTARPISPPDATRPPAPPVFAGASRWPGPATPSSRPCSTRHRQQPVPGGRHRGRDREPQRDRGQLRGPGADPAGGQLCRGLRHVPLRPAQPTLRQQAAGRQLDRDQRHRGGGVLVHRRPADRRPGRRFSRPAPEGPIALVVPSAPGEPVVDTVCLDEVSARARGRSGADRTGAPGGQQLRGRHEHRAGGRGQLSTMSWACRAGEPCRRLGGTAAVSLRRAAARRGHRVGPWRAELRIGCGFAAVHRDSEPSSELS